MPYNKFLGVFIFISLLFGITSGVFIANITNPQKGVVGSDIGQTVPSTEESEEITSKWYIDPDDQTKFCYDSDGGKRDSIRGNVNAQKGTTGMDYCLDQKTLVEYYCDELIGKITNVNCENCVDGECVASTESVIVGAPFSDL